MKVIENMGGVGRSSRTPFKHWILNAELGRLCGIFAHCPLKVVAKANPFLVVDLCAGDGAFGGGVNSSPAIISRHLEWADCRGVRVRAVFIEKKVGTFELLLKNVEQKSWMLFRNEDARDYVLHAKDRQAVFLHSDPNHIHDWPISDDLLGSCSETTTMLATLGCNVGGLKKLARDRREQWYEHVQSCLSAMPRYHDAVLVSLEGDASQWAYLLRLPKKWSQDTCKSILSRGSKWTRFELGIASYRQEREQFEAMQDRLFLTAKERGVL